MKTRFVNFIRVWGGTVDFREPSWVKKCMFKVDLNLPKINEHQFSKNFPQKSLTIQRATHQKNFEEKSFCFHRKRAKIRKIGDLSKIEFFPKSF